MQAPGGSDLKLFKS